MVGVSDEERGNGSFESGYEKENRKRDSWILLKII